MKFIFRMSIGLFLVQLLGGWGYLVHRTVNQLAIYQLPKKMLPFFYSHKELLVKESVTPDVRRSTDPAEAPRHFIDLEAYGDSAAWKMPHRWENAVTQFSNDSLVKYGFLPYEVLRIEAAADRCF